MVECVLWCGNRSVLLGTFLVPCVVLCRVVCVCEGQRTVMGIVSPQAQPTLLMQESLTLS